MLTLLLTIGAIALLWVTLQLVWSVWMYEQGRKLAAHAAVAAQNGDVQLATRCMNWLDMLHEDYDVRLAHCTPWHWRHCRRLYSDTAMREVGLLNQTVRQS